MPKNGLKVLASKWETLGRNLALIVIAKQLTLKYNNTLNSTDTISIRWKAALRQPDSLLAL
jgi:hypothetical protein